MTFENQETIPVWTGKCRKNPRARSPIANGKRLIMADGRGLWAKRFTEICAGHCQDLGGFENLSQAELAIIKRAATLQVELEAQETRLARGEGKINLAEFAQVSNGLRRLLEAIGLKRVPRDCTPDLRDILAAHNAAPAKAAHVPKAPAGTTLEAEPAEPLHGAPEPSTGAVE